MPLSTTLRLKAGPDGPEEELVCILPDEEAHTLEAFVSYVRALETLSLLREERTMSVQAHIENGESVFSAELPDWEAVMPLLHRLRPILLKDEHASFEVVQSLLGRRVPSRRFRSLLRFAREIFDGRHSQRLVRISANETIVNSERVLMKWLNAYEYHRDQALKAEIDGLLAMLPGDLLRFIFLHLLLEKVRAAQALAGLADLVLGRRSTFTAKVPSRAPAVSPGMQRTRVARR